jgi:hypothetical protein
MDLLFTDTWRSGGQYHWCSECKTPPYVHEYEESHTNHAFPVAPPKYQKFLSYTVGYLCVLGWHASLAGTCYVRMLPTSRRNRNANSINAIYRLPDNKSKP